MSLVLEEEKAWARNEGVDAAPDGEGSLPCQGRVGSCVFLAAINLSCVENLAEAVSDLPDVPWESWCCVALLSDANAPMFRVTAARPTPQDTPRLQPSSSSPLTYDVPTRPTIDPGLDTFRLEYLLVPCGILSLILTYNYRPTEVLWAFSIYLEAVAILPQLFMLQRTGEAETITTHYLAALGIYRALYIPNWIYRCAVFLSAVPVTPTY